MYKSLVYLIHVNGTTHLRLNSRPTHKLAERACYICKHLVSQSSVATEVQSEQHGIKVGMWCATSPTRFTGPTLFFQDHKFTPFCYTFGHHFFKIHSIMRKPTPFCQHNSATAHITKNSIYCSGGCFWWPNNKQETVAILLSRCEPKSCTCAVC